MYVGFQKGLDLCDEYGLVRLRDLLQRAMEGLMRPGEELTRPVQSEGLGEIQDPHDFYPAVGDAGGRGFAAVARITCFGKAGKKSNA